MPMIETEYEGKVYTVPSTGADEDFDSLLQDVPDDEHAMAFLMQDGNLGVPGGRYGSDTRSCAPVAIAVSRIMREHSGETTTYYMLNSDMGLVVNSSDDVAYLIVSSEWIDGIVAEDLLDEEARARTDNDN